jgi:hypothetical protein
MRTNLHNVVQNPDERVAILEPGRQVSSINSHWMKTHLRNTWNFCRLYLIVFAVVRVVWKGFCGSSNWPGPEEDALCSETPDEDALIRSPSRWWILLSIQQTKGNQCMLRKPNRGETDRVETTIIIRHWSPYIFPNKPRPTVIVERSARQRNFRLHSVVHERSDAP